MFIFYGKGHLYMTALHIIVEDQQLFSFDFSWVINSLFFKGHEWRIGFDGSSIWPTDRKNIGNVAP